MTPSSTQILPFTSSIRRHPTAVNAPLEAGMQSDPSTTTVECPRFRFATTPDPVPRISTWSVQPPAARSTAPTGTAPAVRTWGGMSTGPRGTCRRQALGTGHHLGLGAVSGTIYRQGLIRLGKRSIQWGTYYNSEGKIYGWERNAISVGDILNQCRNTYG